jgi:hypothetical protein
MVNATSGAARRAQFSLTFTAVLALAASPAVGQEEPTDVGEATARYEEPFSMITGLRELSDGRVMVADALDESLYELTADLKSGIKLGRNGQGPQEYKQPDALFAMAGDTTLMTDLGNGRLTIVAPDGAFARTIPIAQDDDGRLLLVLPGGVDGAGNLFFRPMGDGMIGDSAAVVRWDPAGGLTDTLATIKLQDVTERSSGGANNMRTEVMPVPLSPQDAWAVAGDGSLAVVRTVDYSVEWVRPDGSIVRGPANTWEPVKIRSADKEEWVDQMANTGLMMMVTNDSGELRTSMRRGMGGRGGPDPDSFQWPEVKPPFDPGGVDVAPDGTLWVRRFVAAGERPPYDVFGADGSLRGTVTFPEGRGRRVRGRATGVS